jgi:hypothetical protein
LHRIANLLGRCAGRQAKVQGARFGVQHGAAGQRIQPQVERLAEKGHLGAVAPVDARRVEPARAFALFVQLAQDPRRFLAQRGFDFCHAYPARRTDRQAFGGDDEADAAPARPAQRVGDAVAVERDVALGTRMHEPRCTVLHAGRGRGRRRLVEQRQLHRGQGIGAERHSRGF